MIYQDKKLFNKMFQIFQVNLISILYTELCLYAGWPGLLIFGAKFQKFATSIPVKREGYVFESLKYFLQRFYTFL